ncbi:MAG: hypothetical protein H0U74_05250 [Bradymonadaceae bacterium]|nr:hypothetical protein [Lujinxingiaceae bacterium]
MEQKSPDNANALHAVQAELVSAESCADDVRATAKLGPILTIDEPVEIEADVAPTTFIIDVDWDEARGYGRVDARLLPEEVASKVEHLPLPVLLPALGDILERMVVVTDEYWYAASVAFEDHTVLVQASRIGFEREGDEGREIEERIVENDFLVSRNSLIATLSFPAFGLVYTIDVECENPDTNVLCTEDDYILSLANAMSIAGGTL